MASRENSAREVNFDGLVGLSHNYSGLSYGNMASSNNEGQMSNPQQGALQGIAKMAALADMGLRQGVLPPQDRPHLATLRKLGFTGTDAEIIASAASTSSALFANVSSASCMWTANAATVSPKADTKDGRTHFTPANLAAMFHRSIEADTTARILKAYFPEGDHFAHHAPLEGGVHMGDEGAANHNRFCASYGAPGTALFVYGRRAFEARPDLAFPGRQTREASEAVARCHGLSADRTVFVQQSAKAINAGAFHNDVVAVSNRHVFFYHEEAFDDAAQLQLALKAASPGMELEFIEVPAAKVPLADAVKSYLFNSQLVSVENGSGSEEMALILPTEAQDTETTKKYVAALIESGGAIKQAHYMDVRQSMRNGGGPACLRLRVVLDGADEAVMKARVLLEGRLREDLENWVRRHYRDRLERRDLADPAFALEGMQALDELTALLKLGSVYDFQR